MTQIGLALFDSVLHKAFLAYSALVVLHYLAQTLFAHLTWRRSREQAGADPLAAAWTPSVDVVVPCYNETPTRLRACFEALLAQDYAGEVRVYVVDDGSTNRDYVLPVYRKYEALDGWSVLLPERNQGKRHAQGLAIVRGEGALVVTIDSDTEIARDGIRQIVEAFRDARVGAVTGNVGASNRRYNLLTRLIDLRYWVAFNQERAAQSWFGSVLCCSGPFAVYRRAALEKVWDSYIAQTFRGTPCTFGDDRHLTNLVLAAGYQALYEPLACAITNVPTTIPEYARQQLRWNKSFYRELLWTFPYLPQRPLYMSFEIVVQTILPALLTVAVVAALGSALLSGPAHLLRYALAVTIMALLHCTYGAARTRNPRFVLFVLYGFLHAGLLIPLRIRALATLTDNRWGTRTSARAGQSARRLLAAGVTGSAPGAPATVRDPGRAARTSRPAGRRRRRG